MSPLKTAQRSKHWKQIFKAFGKAQYIEFFVFSPPLFMVATKKTRFYREPNSRIRYYYFATTIPVDPGFV